MNPELIPLDQVRTTLTQLVGALMPLDHGAGSADGIPARASDYVSTIGTRSGYVREFDTSSVGDDPFEVMSHQEIWDKAGTIEPGDVAGSAQNWRSLGQTAAEDTVAFAEELSAAISENWQGIAADAASDGVVRYSNSSLALVIASDDLAHKVMDTHSGVAAAKSNLPPPVPYATGEKLIDAGTWLARTLLPGDIKSIQYAHEEAEEAARAVMKTEYAPAIRQAAERVPVLPAAQNPLNGADGGVAGDGWGWHEGGGSGAYGGGTSSGQSYGSPLGTSGTGSNGASDPASIPASNAAETAPQDAATRAAGWAPGDASGAGQSAGGGAGPGGGSSGTSTSPAAATNQSASGGSMLAGPGGGAAGGSRFGGAGDRISSGAGGGTSGSPSRQFGSGVGGLGDAGGSRGGPAPGAGGFAAGAAPNAGRAGAPGMGGMGGMAPAAGRGGGAGDDVHKTPGYLIDAVNGDELVGTLPLVAPPVLGE